MSFRSRWNHVPDSLPLQTNPLWQWPPNFSGAAMWWWKSWFPFTVSLAIVGLSFAVFLTVSPTLEQTTEPGWWIVAIYLRNLVLVSLLAQGLHIVLYKKAFQGQGKKYDPRPYPRKGKTYTFGDQYLDNVFWAIASGVTIWTGFECLVWWAMANGIAPVWQWSDGPVWFLFAFFLIPIWESLYFYVIHRILHTPLFYRFHALHHRNTDVGPWTGLSMHPVEHLFYFGTALIHFVVPTHPVHLICHLMFFALYAVTTHSGFEGLWAKGKKKLHLGNFHHQLHHRFFEVNYGTMEVPMDKFFDTFHDGTEAAQDRMKERVRERVQQNQQ